LLVAFFWACGDIFYRLINVHCFNNHTEQYISKWMITCFFNSTIGFCVMLTFWWCAYIDEPIVIPNVYQLIWIGILCFLIILANLMQFLSISMTSPFFLNIAMFGKIPLSFIADVFIHHYEITWLSILGSFLIIAGFVMLEVVNPPISWRLCRKAIIGDEISLDDKKDNYQKLIVEKNFHFDEGDNNDNDNNNNNNNDNENVDNNNNDNDNVNNSIENNNHYNVQNEETKMAISNNKQNLYHLLNTTNKRSLRESVASIGGAPFTLSNDATLCDARTSLVSSLQQS